MEHKWTLKRESLDDEGDGLEIMESWAKVSKELTKKAVVKSVAKAEPVRMESARVVDEDAGAFELQEYWEILSKNGGWNPFEGLDEGAKQGSYIDKDALRAYEPTQVGTEGPDQMAPETIIQPKDFADLKDMKLKMHDLKAKAAADPTLNKTVKSRISALQKEIDKLSNDIAKNSKS